MVGDTDASILGSILTEKVEMGRLLISSAAADVKDRAIKEAMRSE